MSDSASSLAPRAQSAAGEQTPLYGLVARATRPFVRMLFRPRGRGMEHLPAEGGFVLSANQQSNLDGFALAYLLYPRQLRWMGKAELFHPSVAWALTRLGIFPVRRGEGDIQAVATAVELAGQGHIVGIFPEGTRRSKGRDEAREARPHTGAARIVLAAGVPLVPAAIVGTERLALLRRWRVAFGPAVGTTGLSDATRPAARELTARLWSSICTLEAELELERLSRRLRPRLQLDIGIADLVLALASCAGVGRNGRAEHVLEATGDTAAATVCLSVRSAFDLLLEALPLTPGDEVAISALTHPDMARIIEAHGLRAIPVDIDPRTLAPVVDNLERALSPRTRVLVVAHLFGGRVDLQPLSDVARRHDLLLVEDCAQSLLGAGDRGSPVADVSLFSFGPIKRATALGGCVVRVRRPALLRRMEHLQDGWPLQSRLEFAGRVLKFTGLVALSHPRAYWLFARALPLLGRDLDSVVAGSVRGFPAADLLDRIRRRPAGPLLALLARRLRRFNAQRLLQRVRIGERVVKGLPDPFAYPGRGSLDQTFWVFPVTAPDPSVLIRSLRQAGFDASRATSSIAAIAPPADRSDLAPVEAERLRDRIVFLPVYPELEDAEVTRLLGAVHRAAHVA